MVAAVAEAAVADPAAAVAVDQVADSPRHAPYWRERTHILSLFILPPIKYYAKLCL